MVGITRSAAFSASVSVPKSYECAFLMPNCTHEICAVCSMVPRNHSFCRQHVFFTVSSSISLGVLKFSMLRSRGWERNKKQNHFNYMALFAILGSITLCDIMFLLQLTCRTCSWQVLFSFSILKNIRGFLVSKQFTCLIWIHFHTNAYFFVIFIVFCSY